MTTAQSNINDELPTDSGLLLRIRKPEDAESWREFFKLYKPSIAGLAMKGGLSSAEADEVLQETMLAVSRGIGTFEYNRAQGSFKGWLFTITRRAMFRQFRKRASSRDRSSSARDKAAKSDTAAVSRPDLLGESSESFDDELALLPDPAPGLEDYFDKEWRNAVLAVALKRVSQQVKPKQFQMFDLYVTQQQPMSKVTRALNVNPAQVYMAKLRVSALLRQTIATLERDLI